MAFTASSPVASTITSATNSLNEFVDLINGMDTAYKSELREMNELNFARFDAKLEQRGKRCRAAGGDRRNAREARMEITALRAEMRTETQAQKAGSHQVDVLVLPGVGAGERAVEVGEPRRGHRSA